MNRKPCEQTKKLQRVMSEARQAAAKASKKGDTVAEHQAMQRYQYAFAAIQELNERQQP